MTWLNLLAGIWLILCGFIHSIRHPVSMIVAGAVALIFGLASAARNKDWKGGIMALIGIWLLISGIWLHILPIWNFLIFGVALIIFSLWEISEHSNPVSRTIIKDIP